MQQIPIQMQKVVDKIQHWRNERILDAVEFMENGTANRDMLQEHGKLCLYDNGDMEFFWKGKLAIHFPKPELDAMCMLQMEAILVYNDEKITKTL